MPGRPSSEHSIAGISIKVSPTCDRITSRTTPFQKMYNPVGASPWLNNTRSSLQAIGVACFLSASTNSWSAINAFGSIFIYELLHRTGMMTLLLVGPGGSEARCDTIGGQVPRMGESAPEPPLRPWELDPRHPES